MSAKQFGVAGYSPKIPYIWIHEKWDLLEDSVSWLYIVLWQMIVYSNVHVPWDKETSFNDFYNICTIYW